VFVPALLVFFTKAFEQVRGAVVRTPTVAEPSKVRVLLVKIPTAREPSKVRVLLVKNTTVAEDVRRASEGCCW